MPLSYCGNVNAVQEGEVRSVTQVRPSAEMGRNPVCHRVGSSRCSINGDDVPCSNSELDVSFWQRWDQIGSGWEAVCSQPVLPQTAARFSQ